MYDQGFEVSVGETKRSDEQAEINAIGQQGRERVAELIVVEFPELAKKLINNGAANGVRNSTHLFQLAIDLNLFKDGVFLSTTEDHRPFGEWWEQQAPDARWGGRFKDGNHYSLEFGGVK